MKHLNIIIGVLVGIGALAGLCQQKIIGADTAITVGILGVLFVFFFIDLKSSIDPITNAMAELQKFLGESKLKFTPLHEIKPTGYLETRSPINLSTLGNQLLEQSGAKAAVDDHYDELSQSLAGRITAYDVQEESGLVIARYEDAEWMGTLKGFAYRNPMFLGNPLTFVDIKKVMAIYLRNRYLTEHQEIPQ